MKRMLWLMVIAVGGVVLLMLASIALQQHAARPVEDLRTPATMLAEGLDRWDFEKVKAATDDPVILTDRYESWFKSAHSNNPAQERLLAGLISSLEAFPSMTFPGVKPDRVDVRYEVKDGQSAAHMAAGFVPKDGGGWILRLARPAVGSDDNTSKSPIRFSEGDNVSVSAVVHRLFDALMTGRPEDLAPVMSGADNATVARQIIDTLREEVVSCRADRLEQMLPAVGRMPKGWTSLWLGIIARPEGRPTMLEMVMAPKPDGGARLVRFRCRLLSERTTSVLPEPSPKPLPAPEGKK